MSILIQILTGTKNFRILPDFQISSLARVIKNLIFEPNFQNNSKFLDVKFHPLQVQSVSSKVSPNVWRNWKFLDFAKFHPSHVASGQKCQFWAKFLTWIKMLTLQNVILRRSGVVKLLISSQILNATENIWILPNFILHRSGVVKNLFFEPDFQHKSKFFWILSNFILCWFRVVNTLIF